MLRINCPSFKSLLCPTFLPFSSLKLQFHSIFHFCFSDHLCSTIPILQNLFVQSASMVPFQFPEFCKCSEVNTQIQRFDADIIYITFVFQYSVFQLHPLTYKLISCLFIAEYISFIYTYHIFINYLLVNRHLGYFYVLAVENR